MSYPVVKGERDTLAAMSRGFSIARFGDQEFMLMLGANGISQTCNQTLRTELREVMARPAAKCLVGVPYVDYRNPFVDSWSAWSEAFGPLMPKHRTYFSAFVTRPDQAPWTNTPEHFDLIEDLWRDKDVTLVGNGMRSLTVKMLSSAKSVSFVPCFFRNAYAEIDLLEKWCMDGPKTVLLCAGPTATCLANRLAARGKHALDLGHIGRFWRRYEEIEHWNNEREIDKVSGLVKENPHGL